MSMTTTDQIADMLTRIRNAIMVRRNEISLPHSKTKEAIAKLLQENKFIDRKKKNNTSTVFFISRIVPSTLCLNSLFSE